jgi:hypothetical protein
MPEKRATSLDIQLFASFVASFKSEIWARTLEGAVPKEEVLDATALDVVRMSRRSAPKSG